MNVPLLDLQAQYVSLRDDLQQAIDRVMSSQRFVLGDEVRRLETSLAEYCQTKHAIGCASGSDALLLALMALDLKPGDEVITTSFSFFATAASVARLGARPVFVDIDPLTCNIDPAKIEAAITSRTKVIMPVHLYGTCADMDPILEIAARHNVLVIEDAAQAHGAEYKGRRAGTMGALACFSFYPGKNLGAYGEAGAVVTNDEKYVDVIKQLRDQGQSAKYLHDRVGYNYRMEAIQGAVLQVKLKHLDAWTNARRELAKIYSDELVDSGVRLLAEPDQCKAVYHVFPLFSRERDELREHLHANGISTGVHYPIPVHLQRGFSNLGFSEGDLPLTEQVCREVLSLPMYPELEHATARQIADSVRQFAQRAVAVHP